MQDKNSEPVLDSTHAQPAARISTQELSADELSSQELFRKSNTVRIDHAGQTYWLRLTRGNKLILTK